MLGLFKKKKVDRERVLLFVERQNAKEEVERAIGYLRVAEQQFNDCDDLFFEVANERLNIARKNVDNAIQRYKLLSKV